MAIPQVSMRQLLEAGVHFGHHARRWNPKMRKYIFGVRNGIHILDLQQTVPNMKDALEFLRTTTAKGGRVLFVGTKRQAQDKVAEAANRSGQFYVNHRWLGGMLTNWQTVTNSINRMKELNGILDGENTGLRSKKELLMLQRERDRLVKVIGGIAEMGGTPDAIFILDTNKEDIAIAEANKLGIPVVAVLDSNCNPDGIDYPIPGNDDAIRAIELYCDLAVGAILDGVSAQLKSAGADLGAATDVKVDLPAEKKAKAAKEESAETAETEATEEAEKKAASA
ncbi:MAG: 30S ribosomal protein S2 [Pseudobdellovibrionaceae bacterium]